MKRTLTTLLLAAVACTTAAAAFADRTRVQLTDPSQRVELSVDIEWGSIRILGDPDAAELTIEARADRPGEVASGLITVGEDGNLVTVRQSPLRPGVFRSAHLEISTPLATSVTLRMNRGGDIWVRGLRGQVEVTNLNGSVELADIAGAAAVNASNGSIRASFAEVDPGRDMVFTSLNGSIELCLPATFSAGVHLTTAGDAIRSDFPIDREDPVRTVAPGGELTVDSSEVQGRIGSGEARLRVSTLNGEILLERCDRSRSTARAPARQSGL